jgi:hypothetical protein
MAGFSDHRMIFSLQKLVSVLALVLSTKGMPTTMTERGDLAFDKAVSKAGEVESSTSIAEPATKQSPEISRFKWPICGGSHEGPPYW